MKERVKILRDFQISCKKRTGRALSQKKDPRVQLISVPKLRANSKSDEKKVHAMCYGPAENPHVAYYREALTRYPVSMHRNKWTNEDRDNLAKGVKQQFQEMLLQRSLDLLGDTDGTPGDSNDVDAIVTSIRDVNFTPEKMRAFLPNVNWELLASMYLPGRSGAECQARWLNTEDPLINHQRWTKTEDMALLHIVQQKGISNWIDISVSLGTNRTPFECLARYQRSLNASIIKSDVWTEEEDNILREAVEAYGESNWQIVASALEGRTGTQCSNRWRKQLVPERKGKWTPDEDKHLKVAVMLFGPRTWNKISQFVPGRTQVQCRERWVNCLDPSLNMDKWSKEEDSLLEAIISEHGYSAERGYCWSKIASCIPNRTDNQCLRRWKILRPHEVPLLQAAKKLQKAALISNFVDRESERPALGPTDFVPLKLITYTSESENVDPSGKQKRRSSNNCSENVLRLTNGGEVDDIDSDLRKKKKKQQHPRNKMSKNKNSGASEDQPSPCPGTAISVLTNGEELTSASENISAGNKKDLIIRNKRPRRRPESKGSAPIDAAIVHKEKRLEYPSPDICEASEPMEDYPDPSVSMVNNGEAGRGPAVVAATTHKKSSKLQPNKKSYTKPKEVPQLSIPSDVGTCNGDVTRPGLKNQCVPMAHTYPESRTAEKNINGANDAVSPISGVEKTMTDQPSEKNILSEPSLEGEKLSTSPYRGVELQHKETTQPAGESQILSSIYAGPDILETGLCPTIEMQDGLVMSKAEGEMSIENLLEEEQDDDMTLSSFIKKSGGQKISSRASAKFPSLYQENVRRISVVKATGGDTTASEICGGKTPKRLRPVDASTSPGKSDEGGDDLTLANFCNRRMKKRKVEHPHPSLDP